MLPIHLGDVENDREVAYYGAITPAELKEFHRRNGRVNDELIDSSPYLKDLRDKKTDEKK